MSNWTLQNEEMNLFVAIEKRWRQTGGAGSAQTQEGGQRTWEQGRGRRYQGLVLIWCIHEGKYTGAMRNFSDFISELGLLDLPLLEGQFTWSNNQDPPSKSRIDKFLLSSDWEDHFSNMAQKALPRFVSDYCPISLDNESFMQGSLISSLRICGFAIRTLRRKLKFGGGVMIFKAVQASF